MIDKVTTRWIKNAADEHAAANGCRFDESRAEHVVDFIQNNLRLYEGEYAGKAMELMEWQLDLIHRLFGWVHFSKDWNREIRRFRKCSLFVPKKSGKSPTISALALYCAIADGEQGQHIWLAAKDGQQAGIAYGHVLAMIEQSPALMATCKINKVSKSISHAATRSTIAVLPSENWKSQHGLNGSVFIDEAHVVPDRLAEVLEYMGASRSEPIQFEASTAGMNPLCYGKRQFDYGRAVNDGTIKDDAFLFVNYSAPQDASEEDLGREELWKKANPSWGVTIKGGEFRQSYERARRSLSDWNAFKVFRLNVWSTSSTIWLRSSDWNSCASEIAPEDFAGMPCVIGLDLSRTRDMSAAVACFKMEEDYYLLPFFWLPEETAKANDHHAPYLEWARDGFLELTPGNVVDYAYIERRIAELAETYNVQEVCYDRTYAEELTQRLESEHGIPRTVFPQTIMHFAGPTAEFERLVIGGQLHHADHPVLTWQAGHVQVKTDLNMNKRPVKPQNDDPKKIDGIVAAIMALARTMAEDAQPVLDYYETHGVELA